MQLKEKKLYVASRFSQGNNVREIYSKLSEIGYTVSENWTKSESIKPYEKDPPSLKKILQHR